ncbi:hypothetical protein PS664_03325 [Pseudomonas fluorescens]|nr:hypothetical protein PS664_03325 [Pseudomonas fluorescens]
MNRDVLRQQRLGQGLELRPQGQGAGQVGGAEGVFFNADKMQSGAGRCVLIEQLPRAEEIQPGAEAGLADHKARALGQLGKTRLQTVLFEKHVAGFFQA